MTHGSSQKLWRSFTSLGLEEQILNGGTLLALLGLFLPWLSGEWLGGESITYSGFGFFTSFLGIAIFFLHAFVLLVTLVPLLGGPILLRKRYKEFVRLCLTSQTAVLTLAALSVLTKITFEFSRMEVRFGVYTTLIGSLIATLYAFLRLHEQRHTRATELFHHPEDQSVPVDREDLAPHHPPPPPPPAPPPVDEHPLYPR